jgi:uncharacterized membrane protein
MPSPSLAARSAIIATMRHTHVPTPAILLVVASVFCFTLLDTIMKFATQRYPLPVLIFARYAVQMVAMLVWLGPSMRFDLLRTQRLPLQIVRALILLLSSVFFVGALKALPLAEATALNYSTPMIVVLMARVFLGERLTPLRIAFVIAGAIGMLLIVRPGGTVFRAPLATPCSPRCSTPATRSDAPAVRRKSTRAAVLSGDHRHAGDVDRSPGFDWPLDTAVDSSAIDRLRRPAGYARAFPVRSRVPPCAGFVDHAFTYMQLVWAMLAEWVVYRQFPDVRRRRLIVIAGSGLTVALLDRRRARQLALDPLTVA